MKYGPTVTTQKQNNSPLRRKSHSFHIQRKWGKSGYIQTVDDLFDFEGIAHQELVLSGLTLMHLQQLRKQVCRKHLNNSLTRTGSDNALAHTTFFMHQFLATKNMVMVSHPPYSPDLDTCEFFFLLRMKSHLWRCSFQHIPEIEEQ